MSWCDYSRHRSVVLPTELFRSLPNPFKNPSRARSKNASSLASKGFKLGLRNFLKSSLGRRYKTYTETFGSSTGAEMKATMLVALKLLHSIGFVSVAIGLPTLGHVDRERLETYEVLSEESNDVNVFNNLTFNFTCETKAVGLYADVDYYCRIFHACDNDGKGFPVICPNYTIFDQKERTCSDDEGVDCDSAQEWYYLNDLPYTNATSEKDANDSWQNDDDVASVLSYIPI